MAEMTLKDIAEKMKDIDFTMLSTVTDNGAIAARPMSNNGQVEYDGDSYYFTCDHHRLVRDIEANPKVGLALQGKSGILGQRPFFLTIEGRATLIRDKAAFAEHWTKDLEIWFKDGIDTEGLTLIKVHGERAHYWNGFDEGEIVLERAAAVAG